MPHADYSCFALNGEKSSNVLRLQQKNNSTFQYVPTNPRLFHFCADDQDLELFDWFPVSPPSNPQDQTGDDLANLIVPLSPPPVSDPVGPAGPVLEYQNHKTVLPAETRPQVRRLLYSAYDDGVGGSEVME